MNARTLILGVLGLAVLCMTALAVTLWPEAKITVHIIDDDKQPVEAANVHIGFEAVSGKGEKRDGVTDAKGIFEVTTNTAFRIYARVTKTNYYTSEAVYEYQLGQLNGLKIMPQKWEPYNAVIDVPFRKIINPIPMYARRVNIAIPEFGKPLGFDLSMGDWIAPHGAGKTTDMIFTAELNKKAERDFDYTLVVSFPNKGDGIQTFEAPYNYGSELKSPHQAPEGGYQPQWVQSRSQVPDQPEKSNYDLKRNYFIRVRTVLDEKGNVKSANYGKIYGDFMSFVSYLNPTFKDRNVEFDPKRNLITGLKGTEQVTNP